MTNHVIIILINVIFFPQVLRPHCNVSNLKFCSYCVSEHVSTGPTFDQELINETATATAEGQQLLEDKYHANRFSYSLVV